MHMMKRQHKNREEFRKQPEESSFEQSFVVMHFLKVMEDQKLITQQVSSDIQKFQECWAECIPISGRSGEATISLCCPLLSTKTSSGNQSAILLAQVHIYLQETWLVNEKIILAIPKAFHAQADLPTRKNIKETRDNFYFCQNQKQNENKF